MQPAQIPDNESARLAALHRYEILDSPAEAEFDDLVQLAAQICGVPISLVTLIDSERQWIKSKVGIEADETSRDVAFCAHTILEDGILEVRDAGEDARFHDNPLVTGEPCVRFYAGAPLTTPDGRNLGALCVIDRVPRSLTQLQRDGLQRLSRQVVALMELRLRNRQLVIQSAVQNSILAGAALAIIATTPEGVITQFNPAAEQALGYKAAEMVGIHTPKVFHLPAEIAARAAELSTELGREVAPGFEVFIAKARTGLPETREWSYVRKDGSRFPVLLSVSTLRDEQGEITGFLGMARDLSEQKAMKAAQEERNRFFELSAELLCIASTDGSFKRVNPTFTKVLGYSEAELIGTPYMEIVHPDDVQSVMREVEKLTKGEQTIDFDSRLRTKSGEWKTLSWQSNPQPDGTIYSAARDVTEPRQRAEEKRKAEEALREIDARLQRTIAGSGIGCWDWNPQTNEVIYSGNWAGMLDYDPVELPPRFETWEKLVHPEDKPRVLAAIQDHLHGRSSTYEAEHRLRTKGGEWRWILTRGNIVSRDTAGQPLHLSGIHIDIHDRKQAEESLHQLNANLEHIVAERTSALAASERKFHDLFEFAPDGIVLTDGDGVITLINQQAEKLFGYQRGELLGKSAERLIPEAFRRGQRERYLSNTQTSGQTGLEGRRKDGADFIAEVSLCLLETEGGQMIAAAVRDVTERVLTEKKDRRTQRLESIGTLAGGVAHDLNNALAPILMCATMLRKKHPDSADVMETIESSARRGADMVRQLMAFAKGAEGARVLVQSEHLFREVEKIIHSTFPKNIQTRVSYGTELPAIVGDFTQLHQVLLNLCVNARDAMPSGGTLFLQTDTTQLDATIDRDAAPGRYVVWRIKDTGTGIPPEILERIFEPFFSTKGPDLGTGLGLSTVSGIVKGHGGFIRVNSSPRKGTEFAVYFPAAVCTSDESETQSDEEIPTLRGNGETILIVDDELSVRKIAAAVLTHLNFNPITASDGPEALIKVAEHRAELRAVITDLHMPYMDGITFLKALRRMMPKVGIIVASGRMDEQDMSEFRALEVNAILEKPFTQETLVEALEMVFLFAPQ